MNTKFKLKLIFVLAAASCIVPVTMFNATFATNAQETIEPRCTTGTQVKLSDDLIQRLHENVLTEEEGNKVIDLAEKYNESLLTSNATSLTATQSNSAETPDDILQKMKSLGAIELKNGDISISSPGLNRAGINDNNDVPFCPDDTETINWVGIEQEIYYRGETHRVIEIMAQPTAVNGKLYNNVVNENIYTRSKLSEQIFNVYKGKLISSIIGYVNDKILDSFPILEWLPYELLFGDDTTKLNHSSDTYFANLRCNTTMMYTFVYNKNLDEYDFMLTTHYTSVNVATTYYLTGPNGEFSTKLTEQNFNVHSQHYDSPRTAIRYMLDYRPDFISNMPFVYCEPGITMTVNNRAVFLEFKTYIDFVGLV